MASVLSIEEAAISVVSRFIAGYRPHRSTDAIFDLKRRA
jgi:hypothetical protein